MYLILLYFLCVFLASLRLQYIHRFNPSFVRLPSPSCFFFIRLRSPSCLLACFYLSIEHAPHLTLHCVRSSSYYSPSSHFSRNTSFLLVCLSACILSFLLACLNLHLLNLTLHTLRSSATTSILILHTLRPAMTSIFRFRFRFLFHFTSFYCPIAKFIIIAK